MPEKPTSVAGQRIAAFLIDSIIAFLLMALVWFLLVHRFDADTSTGGGFEIGDTRYAFSNDGARGAWGLFSLIDYLAIFVILPGLRGWSPGRRLMKIRLVKADGSPPGVGRALLRYVLFIVVDSFPYFLPLVGFVMILTTRANQRVGDLAAGTYTVKEQYAGQAVEPLLAAAAAPAGFAPAARAGTPPPAPAAPAGPAPGWYDDPQGQARLRWWDGQAWTDQTSA